MLHRHCALFIGLLAGIACGSALTINHPAAATPTVWGPVIEAPVRQDLHASCARFADELEEALDAVWARERLVGDVEVQVTMESGRIDAVQTRGRFSLLNHRVRTEVQRLSCGPQAPAGRQVFRFKVSFVDPDRAAHARGAAVAGLKR